MATLDELRSELPIVVKRDDEWSVGEKDEKDETDDDFISDDDMEVNLSNALSLLEDCCGMLETLADPRLNNYISTYMSTEVLRLAQESRAFLEQYTV